MSAGAGLGQIIFNFICPQITQIDADGKNLRESAQSADENPVIWCLTVI
jgi:hypothetical protein